MTPARIAQPLVLLAAAAWLAAAGPAAAATPAELAAAAARECQAGQLDAAAGSLRALLSAVEAAHGPGHDAAALVRLNLAHVERARGDAAAAQALDAGGGGASKGTPDAALQRSLKKLRVCAAVAPAAAPAAPAIALIDRIRLAENRYNRGKYRESLALANDARAAAGPGASPQELAQLYEVLALSHVALGQRKQALEAATAADRFAAQGGDVEIRIKAARLALQLDDLDTAGQRLDSIEPQLSTPRERALFEAARGQLWLRLGSPKVALVHLERALAGYRQAFGPGDAATAAVLHQRGEAYRAAGDFPAAMASLREARDIQARALGADHVETATTTNAIGVLQADLGDWQAADASFERALRPLREQLGATHPQTLSVRTNRALARWGAKPGPEAEAEYADVVTALRGALGPDAPGTSAAVRNLARMRFELGRAAEAEALLAEALAAQEKTLGANHPDLAPTRIEQARLLAQRGALAEAAAEVDRAIAALVAARGDEHRTVVRARTLRARIAVAQGDAATALRQALEASAALARYTRHTFGALSDRQRSLLAGDAQDVIGALLSVESAPPRELFAALLPHRDAVLRSIAAGHASAGGDPQLAELRRRYVAAAIGTSPDSAKRAGELADRIDALEARAASAATLPDRNPEEVLERACARLPADAALVAFAAYDRTAPGAFAPQPALGALVLRGGSCELVRPTFSRNADIEAAAESFARSMRDERADDLASRRALADALLTPLVPAMGGASRWLVIPDGALWGVPFGVLPDPQAETKYLFERVTIGYLTSIHELAEAQAGAFEPGSLASLLIGAPEFGGGTGGPTVLTDTGPCQMAPFEPLPATSSEIEDIGGLVGSPTVLVGAQATKPGVAKALGGKPWLVHFATHAYFAGQGGCTGGAAAGRLGDEERIAPNPLLLSGIALTGANAPEQVGSDAQTGILTAYEVAGLDLRSARLVVLSACDTGTGLRQRGQEVQGLRWGFRAAGAKALVTSLWRSNDVATRSLMHAFYEALVSGDLEDDAFRGAEALRRAQLAQVKTERMLGLQRPLTWANFVFSGVL